MRTYVSKRSIFLLTFILALICVTGACQPATNTNTNTNTSTVNVNAAPANSNSNVAPAGSAINTREPEKYRATLVFTAQTEGGEKTIGIPSLSAEVARNGDDRRVSFKLPDGSDLIYIDHDNKHYVLAPGRKQYAELTPEATGVQIQKLITPGQLVQRLENLKGVERVGDEEVNGRKAEKYRYATTSNTSTQAGQVSTEAFVYVDKETGLPLRSELFAESSGDVKGVKGAHIVAEFRDISTAVEDSLFEIPPGLNKVSPEQVRQQINAVTSTLGAVLKAMLGNMQGASPSTSASPAATTSPTPRP